MKLLSLEKVLELLNVTRLPGDMEELRRFTTELVKEKGEDWITNHQKLLVDQWLSF